VEISWKSGRFTSIPYQLDGPLQAGETVLINGEQGSIYRVRSCAAGGVPAHLCTQVTVLKPPGTLYTYTFGN
jgi:ribose 1,5-bisphosphokinase PhnN